MVGGCRRFRRARRPRGAVVRHPRPARPPCLLAGRQERPATFVAGGRSRADRAPARPPATTSAIPAPSHHRCALEIPRVRSDQARRLSFVRRRPGMRTARGRDADAEAVPRVGPPSRLRLRRLRGGEGGDDALRCSCRGRRRARKAARGWWGAWPAAGTASPRRRRTRDGVAEVGRARRGARRSGAPGAAAASGTAAPGGTSEAEIDEGLARVRGELHRETAVVRVDGARGPPRTRSRRTCPRACSSG